MIVDEDTDKDGDGDEGKAENEDEDEYVGNGEAEDDRSDALQVDTAGNVLAAGRLFAEGSDLLQLMLDLQAQVDSMQTQLNLLQGE